MPARMGLPLKARVLLLGCDSALETDMDSALRSESCEVILAADYRQALDVTRADPVDVLVLDFDTHCRERSRRAWKFSSAERWRRTLVLAGSLEQLALISEMGADWVLMKPLEPSQVRNVIRHLLAGVRSQALAEGWSPEAVCVSEEQPYRRDGGINE